MRWDVLHAQIPRWALAHILFSIDVVVVVIVVLCVSFRFVFSIEYLFYVKPLFHLEEILQIITKTEKQNDCHDGDP